MATNHPLASTAGVEMLASGGNAFDAAIAALFALNVVEPMMVGLFGAGWMNLRLADGTQIIIDNYSTAPAASTSKMYKPISDTWPDYMETEGRRNKVGYLSCGVPGTLKAWIEVVDTWGKLDLESVLQPAIRYAECGFHAGQFLRELIISAQPDLAANSATTATFLPGGQPPDVGDLIVQPHLAESLKCIAVEGSNALYGGILGRIITADILKNGGILTLEDLETYRTIRRRPVGTTYRGYNVVLPPPPCSGGVHIAQILNILEGFDVAALGFGTADSIHLLAECLKIAFADRTAHMSDPDRTDVPASWLTSKEYAARRRIDIDMKTAGRFAGCKASSSESTCTTHITVIDAEGNIACMTQTLNELFGSKVTVPETGIILNNTMALFDPHPGQPNSVTPGGRMISSMSPTIVSKDEQPFLALGTPGGVRIFPSVLQAIINVIDHGMTLQEAVEAPRIWTQGQELEVEEAVAHAEREKLSTRGHEVREVTAVAGGMNGVMIDQQSGCAIGAACWRADGSPIALGGGPARRGTRFTQTAGGDNDSHLIKGKQ